jgi:hypothetical protein
VTLRGLKRLAGWAAKDLLKTSAFLLRSNRAMRYDRKFADCKSFEDYFDFSQNVFGLMQHAPEIIGLLEYASSVQPRCVCEIGTYEGGTNFLISQAIPTVELTVGIDLYVQHTALLRRFCYPNRKLHYLNGSSYTPGTVAAVEQVLGGRQLDFLFIDGDHRYEGVKQDFLSYRHLVREGGIIAFHDIVADYKTRHGNDTGMWAGDVPVFWQRIKCAYPHQEFVRDPEQDGLGIGALEYSSAAPLPPDL